MSLCTSCKLSCGKPYNSVSGWGNPEAKLIVLLDSPGHLLAEKLFIWITKRLGLTGNDIWVDYVFKCQIVGKIKKELATESKEICWDKFPRNEVYNAKSLVLVGNWGPDLVINKKIKNLHGRKDAESECWIIYSFQYLLMNPAECVDAWRVLYKAAEEAGLKPRMVMDVPPFRFPSKKISR
jgi:hypothetical protein